MVRIVMTFSGPLGRFMGSKILLLLLACNVLAVWGAKRISIYKA